MAARDNLDFIKKKLSKEISQKGMTVVDPKGNKTKATNTANTETTSPETSKIR